MGSIIWLNTEKDETIYNTIVIIMSSESKIKH